VSLRWRIAAALGVIAALVSLFGAMASYFSTSDRLERSVDVTLVTRATELERDNNRAAASGGSTGSTAGSDGDESGAAGGFQRPGLCPPAGELAPATAAQLVARDGKVTMCIEGAPRLPVDRTDRRLARSGGERRLRTATAGGREYRVLSFPRQQGGVLQMARDLGEVNGFLSELQVRLAVIGGIGVAAAVCIGWLLARRIVRPVQKLGETAEQIARTQDLTTEIPTEGTAEIGSLARSLTTMVDALATSKRAQQQLVSDASHELRTPLTSLRTNAELLGRGEQLDDAQRRAVVESLQLEVGELSDLVSELVELATDRSGNDEPPELVALGDLARDVASRARRRTGREIDVSVDGTEMVMAMPHTLERAISNLVDNAIKYSPTETTVEIAVVGTRFEVRDRGRGIAPEDLAHVFDRFYRSTDARAEPGSGLGLAIVKQTVDRHGGSVWATSRPGGGAAVGFELAPPTPDTEGQRPPRSPSKKGRD
jgi:two-component system sensor histidine kinase MprB